MKKKNRDEKAPQPEQEKRDDVELTLREIKKERSKANVKDEKVWVKVLKIIFFPFTFIVWLAKKIFAKIKIPLTVKMTIIETAVFAVAIVGFTVFYVTSVRNKLGGVEGAAEYISMLTTTSAILGVVIIVVFAALTALSSQLMLRPVSIMIRQIDAIGADDLSARLSPPDSQDELMELTNRINRTLGNLQQSFEQQQNFVADASHELKTPIAVIQGYASLLKRWGKEKPEILAEGIEAISRESENMKRLVDQLLFLAKLGNLYVTKAPFDLSVAVRDVVEQYKLMSDKHLITFTGDTAIPVETDKSLVTESVRTLIDNAIKYTPENGRIRVTCYQLDNRVEISVTDNGIGISAEDKQHIFERFYRCDKARVREKGGSGLGLSIARSIVESMDGTISVESEVGVGSTFTIKLPLLPAAKTE